MLVSTQCSAKLVILILAEMHINCNNIFQLPTRILHSSCHNVQSWLKHFCYFPQTCTQKQNTEQRENDNENSVNLSKSVKSIYLTMSRSSSREKHSPLTPRSLPEACAQARRRPPQLPVPPPSATTPRSSPEATCSSSTEASAAPSPLQLEEERPLLPAPARRPSMMSAMVCPRAPRRRVIRGRSCLAWETSSLTETTSY
jgi:hypothetical protein